MFAYVVRRSFAGIIMLLVMSFVTILLFFSGPTNPARQSCGKNCSPALIAQTNKALGYDKPIVTQWTDFVSGVVKGRTYPENEALAKAHPEIVVECPAPCLGYSRYFTDTVTNLIKGALPITISLAIVAFILWITGGIVFGVTAALRKGTIIDRGIVASALVFYAFPTFFIGLFLYKFVAIKWQLVPTPEYVPFTENPWSWLSGLILPAITLALFFMAAYVRMTRAFVLESSSEDYIRTAKAKGLAGRRVVGKHTMRAALTPLVTMAGLDLAGLLGGAIITENVFNFNGLGYLAVSGARNNDLPLLVGLVVVAATFVIVANIIVDLLYAVIDPRVRIG